MKGTDTYTTIGYPRIHFGLADMGAASRRMYGGSGISINAFYVRAEAKESDSFDLCTSGYISSRTRENIVKAVENAKSRGLATTCKLSVHSDIPQHVGLGSSTQVILTVLESLSGLFHWALSAYEMIELSGRGRTSLVGAATHFFGGLCVDAGQSYHEGVTYEPSHNPGHRRPALYVGCWDFPANWKVSLFGIELSPSLDTNIEQSFMAQNAPTSKTVGLKTISALYHGILPALIETDYSAFFESLKILNTIGFEKKVLEIQPKVIARILKELWENNVAAGVSSFGPTIFVIHTDDMMNQISSLSRKYKLPVSGPFQVIQKRQNKNGE